MPEISRFYGIVIKMYFGDHAPPHIHAEYGGQEAVFAVRTGAVLGGRLPPRATGLVAEWLDVRRQDVLAAWARAERLEPIGKVEPLP